MNTILKYIVPITLALGLIGCQSDSPKDAPPSQSAQQQSQQTPNKIGQMPQQSATDIDLSDEEAEKFVQAAMNMQKVQMQAQKKMAGIIKDQGLDVQTYQKIAKAKQSGQPDSKSDVSDEQIEKYKSASKAMKKAQPAIQKNMVAAIKDAGMEMQRFQTISQAARQDPAVQQKIKQKMQQQMQGSKSMQPPAPAGK